jgi:hypothetical protein
MEAELEAIPRREGAISAGFSSHYHYDVKMARDLVR